MAAIKDLFLVVTTTTLLFLRIVVSSPVPLAQDGSIPDPPCDPVSTYSPEWFLANVNDDYRRNSSVFENRLLFYTRRCTDDAIRLSCSSDGFYITIWNVWPQSFYNNEHTEPELERCIFSSTTYTQEYYENMSAAFARLARGSATVMHDSADWADPPMDGIFGRIEVPNISEYTDVEELWAINDATSRAAMRGDIYSLPSYHRSLRMAQQRMYKTDMSLRKQGLLSRSEALFEKRAAEDVDWCPGARNWRHERTQPLRHLMDGYDLS
ncbi:hypothetical protein CLAFUW4_07868 [Fulvia fulva]|uniref:Uncharacterized protein n=1 Tax=Passalora fulva TaxID=5499 RepID=A0A9Q8P612_PASFU|nr:uncharacterized protein CLAFUR5_07993 [Fulvia fulva]KAK4628962.1 hypothetical protein CLAFUR4_07873 [Fulvia fulva]KAK4630524.1 hypothetical protein CLAFUR0_07870 [Fulvia fulva]UJO14670.1 hypothetical protein CLAFUR5_07993 [Fulvia fulva]WPV12667.1 hypothetical protein CLAFUW4_07868 [Fulvia fulva]WPV27244.1 hypothetical protein CLAFUW7_07869 [Fulvia fulva]